MIKLKGMLGVLALMATTATAHAAAYCPGFSSMDPQGVKTGQIVGEGPVRFQNALPSGCKAGGKTCWSYGHPVASPGEHVAVFDTAEGYICVEAFTAEGAPLRRGWMPAARIKITSPAPSVSARWWVGTWSMPGETIKISPNKGGLTADAEASLEDGAGRIAEFEGPLTGTGDRLSYFGAPRCRVQLQQMGNEIAVSDNMGCGNGGRLAGVYHRR